MPESLSAWNRGFCKPIIVHLCFWCTTHRALQLIARGLASQLSSVVLLQVWCFLTPQVQRQVVNLVSNDVRRFDDAGPFWIFLGGAPLELAIVVLLLCLHLGPGATFAGIASMLLIIPLQVRVSLLQPVFLHAPLPVWLCAPRLLSHLHGTSAPTP